MQINTEIATELLTDREAAKLLGLSVSTLRNQRTNGVTPGGIPEIPCVKLGRAVRYDRADLRKFIESCKRSA